MRAAKFHLQGDICKRRLFKISVRAGFFSSGFSLRERLVMFGISGLEVLVGPSTVVEGRFLHKTKALIFKTGWRE